MPTVKPLDVAAIEAAATETTVVATVEEHSLVGGLGSAVAEHLLEAGIATRFRRFAAADQFAHTCGDQQFHREANALTPAAISAAVRTLLGGE
jgi:transketolase